ncbi:MAG: 30S ribosomal protein S6 [Rickettsiales bacterium]|nr:30S ribosomal protein S6 [Rickettsiales bacterium]
MAYFETVIVTRRDLTPSANDELIKNYEKLLKDNGAEVFYKENWGLLSLAYPIKKNKKAYYTMIRIDGPAVAVAELERNFRISDDVIRYMTVSLNSKDTTVSSMLKNKKSEETQEQGE